MTTRIAINGFGRIGRYLTRLLAHEPSLALVAVNDVMSMDEAIHLLKYDSVHGRFADVEKLDAERFRVGNATVSYSRHPESRWDWKTPEVDIVVESTGLFTSRHYAKQHLACGAKRVVISAPADDADMTVVMGVNNNALHKKHTIISNASCTTNCLALSLQHIERRFGIVHGHMTTVHPYTLRQRVLDGSHPDIRRARACAENIVPTPVGAHTTVGKVIPSLKGKLLGSALRVPVASVALIDLVCELKTATTTDQVRALLQAATDEHMAFIEEPLVSSDYIGSRHGCLVDGPMTVVTDGTLLRLLAWYDNESGFTHQLARLLRQLSLQ